VNHDDVVMAVTMTAVMGYPLAGGVFFGFMQSEGLISKRQAFTLFILMPITLPLTAVYYLAIGLCKLFKWWLVEPIIEWRAKDFQQSKKKKKPTWDELEVLWQEVSVQLEKLGVPEPPRPKYAVSDRPLSERHNGSITCACYPCEQKHMAELLRGDGR
jgi:hypothetical protein